MLNEFDARNGCALHTPTASVVITSNASTHGWGASCGNSQTGGAKEEAQEHINFLELRAEFLLSDLCSSLGSSAHNAPYRQSNGNFLHQSQGRYSLKETLRPRDPDMDVVLKEIFNHSCRTHSSSSEYQSRLRVLMSCKREQLEAKSNNFPLTDENLHGVRAISICSR